MSVFPVLRVKARNAKSRSSPPLMGAPTPRRSSKKPTDLAISVRRNNVLDDTVRTNSALLVRTSNAPELGVAATAVGADAYWQVAIPTWGALKNRVVMRRIKPGGYQASSSGKASQRALLNTPSS